MRILSKKEVISIYNERMTEDFPENELRPLSMLLKAMEDGTYTCYGLIEDNAIRGYAFLTKLKDSEDYLVDYLAVEKSQRNSGYGTVMLEKLSEMLSQADSVIGEVENPDFAKSEEERKLQARRYNFYMRNDIVDTGVLATCFGANFILLEMKCSKTHSKEEVRQLYRAHYKARLPKEMYDKNISV